jgi:hypothetical protein
MLELRNAWESRDIVKWITIKEELGKYNKELGREDPNFLKDMSLFNTRFTHKEEQDKHYEDWSPYCCSDKPCRSSAMDRMEKTDYGWYCSFCKTSIGKHLYRLDVNFYKQATNHKLTWSDVYGGVLLGDKLNKEL